ncbi:MAG: hypothetical protein K2K97_06450, partial [Muribaculaceae bacterium]|nr:hypothetical protein [Muribaculaceae bacterium]
FIMLLINYCLCHGQGGIVSRNLTLNDRVERFIANNNCSEDELYGLVQLIQTEGDLRQGVRIMNAAIQKFPKNYFAYYMRGFYYKNLEEYEKAISDFSMSISLEPRYAGAILDRGECLLSLNRQPEAFSDFMTAISESERLIAMGLNYNGIEFTKPFAYIGLGRIEEVKKWINGYEGNDYYDIACLYSKMRDFPNTIKYLDMALDTGYAHINFIIADNCMKWLAEKDEFKKLIKKYQQ